jgi:hypothetical protein
MKIMKNVKKKKKNIKAKHVDTVLRFKVMSLFAPC